MATKTEQTFTAEEVLNGLDPIKGEMRIVYQCGYCGQFIGRRFIPFELGRGLTINPCWCYVTDRRTAERMTEVLCAKP